MANREISTKTTAKNLAELLNQYYAKKNELPTNMSDLNNDSGFISETVIDNKIAAAKAGSLQPKGSRTFAALPDPSEAVCNFMYNVTDKFTTNEKFVEGAGHKYPAGTNVAVVNTAESGDPVYKYDAMPGAVDTSGFMEKQPTATNGNFAAFDANGQAVDSGKKPSDFLTEHQNISGKADKVTEATDGNLAGLNGDGNLTDSGIAAGDVQVKTTPTAAGNIATLGADGKLADGGKTVAQLAEKAANPTADHLAALDANGNPTDSGIAKSDVLVATDISDYTVDELKALLGITEDEDE